MPSRYKVYTRSSSNEKYRVKSWIDKRCRKCGRFIGGIKQFLCNRCYKKRHSKLTKINHFERRDQVNYYSMLTIHKVIGISIPMYLRNSLKVYL